MLDFDRLRLYPPVFLPLELVRPMKNPKGPVSGQAPAAAAARRDRRKKSLSDSTDGFWSEVNGSATALLNALTSLRSDDFSVRLPLHWTGMAGQAANAFTEIVVSSERKAKELAELRQAAAETNALLNALNALERGEFSVRLPLDWVGTAGKVADTFNRVVALNEQMAKELARLR